MPIIFSQVKARFFPSPIFPAYDMVKWLTERSCEQAKVRGHDFSKTEKPGTAACLLKATEVEAVCCQKRSSSRILPEAMVK